MTVSDGPQGRPEVYVVGGYTGALDGSLGDPDPAERFASSADVMAAFAGALAALDPEKYGTDVLERLPDDVLTTEVEVALAAAQGGVRSGEALSMMLSPEQLLQAATPAQAAVCAVLAWEVARRATERQANWPNPGGAA